MHQPHNPGLNPAADNMRRKALAHPAAAIVLVGALPFSYTAHAINIGEVVSQSKIGEPLRTQIELTGSGSELVENTCLSLVKPEPQEEGARDFLTSAKFDVKAEGKQRFVVISSHRPYNDPFLRMKLQVRCVGVGNVIKSFTILPEFAEVLPIAAPAAAAETVSTTATGSLSTGPGATSLTMGDVLPERRSTSRSRRGKQRSHAGGRDVSAEAGQPVSRSSSSLSQISPRKRDKETFRLRLSGEAIDESRIGKISQEERSLLLARQKLLDADDQMASFLALQHQVKQLQDELGAVKLKLAQLGVSGPVATPSLAPVQVATQAAPVQEAQPQLQPETTSSEAKTDTAPAQQPARQRKPKIDRGPILIGLFALLALLLGVRYWFRLRAQPTGAKPVLKRSAAAPVIIREPASAPESPVSESGSTMQARIMQPDARATTGPVAIKSPAVRAPESTPEKTRTIAPPGAREMARPAPAAAPAAREKTPDELAEADSIIEEAELYAIHGHPDRAILILKELLQGHATKAEAWMLLFSIYSSLKKVPEFEKSAKDFMRANEGSAKWPEIQALGRSIDPGNSLYADGAAGAAQPAASQPVLGKRLLLGDVLLAMGVLTAADMEKSLAEFDPKTDGRFGGFLVKRNLITEAQLEAALVQQQLGNEANAATQPAATPQAGEPSEPRKEMLPALEFEPPAMDLPKMTKSPESDQADNKPGE